ncbi:hypothetical protein TSMEX_010636 [Taenia solium]|eukprot:TsM_000797300 transcript=TsM_000797300 gene=TsM_000797300
MSTIPVAVDAFWLDGASIGSILVGAVVTALFTLITTHPLSEEDELEVWERTRSIDDPLQPWSEVYGKSVYTPLIVYLFVAKDCLLE